MSLLSEVLYEDCMTFLPECGTDKSLYLSTEQDFSLLKWMHNDSMYVRFAGMRNTKTWSKSRGQSLNPASCNPVSSHQGGMAMAKLAKKV